MINLLYFAAVKDVTYKEKERIDFQGKTVDQLMKWVEETYPETAKMSLQVAVNEEYALPDEVLEDEDTVALIPPVSGG